MQTPASTKLSCCLCAMVARTRTEQVDHLLAGWAGRWTMEQIDYHTMHTIGSDRCQSHDDLLAGVVLDVLSWQQNEAVTKNHGERAARRAQLSQHGIHPGLEPAAIEQSSKETA